MESPVVDVVFVDGRVGQGEEEDEEDGEAKREYADQKITLFWLLINELDLLDKLTSFKHATKLGLYIKYLYKIEIFKDLFTSIVARLIIYGGRALCS